MPDILALWDGFIADSGRPLPLLYYVCVSMIIWVGLAAIVSFGLYICSALGLPPCHCL